MKKIINTESYAYEGTEYILNIDSKYAYRVENGRKVRIPYSVYADNKSRVVAANHIFAVGDKFHEEGLYGGSYDCEIVARTAATVTVRDYWVSEDSWKLCSKDHVYQIVLNKNNDECIKLWEYNGTCGYQVATSENPEAKPTTTDTASQEATEQKGETEMSTTESFTWEGMEFILPSGSKTALRIDNGVETIIPRFVFTDKAGSQKLTEEERRIQFCDYMETVPSNTLETAIDLMGQAGYEADFSFYDLTFIEITTGNAVTPDSIEDVLSFANSVLANTADEAEPEPLTNRVFLVGDRLWDGLGEEVHYEVIDRTAKTVILRKHTWDEFTASDRLSDHEYPIAYDENRNQMVVLYTNSVWGDTCLTATSEDPTTASPEAVVEPTGDQTLKANGWTLKANGWAEKRGEVQIGWFHLDHEMPVETTYECAAWSTITNALPGVYPVFIGNPHMSPAGEVFGEDVYVTMEGIVAHEAMPALYGGAPIHGAVESRVSTGERRECSWHMYGFQLAEYIDTEGEAWEMFNGFHADSEDVEDAWHGGTRKSYQLKYARN